MRKIATIFGILFFLFHNSYAQGATSYTGLDYPVGKPNGAGYYDAQDFGVLNESFGGYHLGEDWNGLCGGDCDFGDHVYSIGNGTVEYTGYKKVWGNVALIVHDFGGNYKIKALYAHFSKMNIVAGQHVSRGSTIGSIGRGDRNMFPAHLHFEIRDNLSIGVGTGYGAKNQKGYLDPSTFIKANRPVPPPEPQKLSITTNGRNGAGLSWDEATGKEFEKYELYRSETAGGTKDSDKREKIGTFTDSKTLSYTDLNLYSGQSYYYRILTHYKNDQVVSSNEVTIKFDREIINVSNKSGIQRYARIMGNKIYWEDMVREQTSFPQKRTFYYYDIEKKIVESIVIGNQIDNRIQGPYKPSIGAEWLCYYGRGSAYKNYDIYCRNMASDMPVDIQITLSGAVDTDPAVSDDGILVWTSLANNIQQVYWTDLNGPPQIQLLSDTSDYQQSPRVWGQGVIWLNYIGPHHKNLMYKNIATGEEKVLVDGVGDGEINIWDDYVTYIKDGELLLLRLTDSGEPTIISTTGQNGHIRDGRVVYTKDGSDGNYIYVYEIATKKTYTVAGPIKFQPSPFIYENMIVFDSSPTDDTNDFDIYLTYL